MELPNCPETLFGSDSEADGLAGNTCFVIPLSERFSEKAIPLGAEFRIVSSMEVVWAKLLKSNPYAFDFLFQDIKAL
jgi:hypothetical protein